MLQLGFKANNNWFDVSGELYRIWDSQDNYYFNNRATPANIQTIVSKGEWNGKQIDVQHIKYEGWYLQFIIHEEYVHSFSDIQSCEYIEVTDLDYGINHVLNIDIIENLELTIEPTGNGTIYLVSMTYRSKKIIINKADPILRKNAIDIKKNNDWFELASQDLNLANCLLAKLTETRIAAFEYSTYTLYMLKNENGVLSIIGNSKVISGATGSKAICRIADNRIAIIYSGTNILAAYEFDELNWNLKGNEKTLSALTNPTITQLDDNQIVYCDETGHSLIAQSFDGVTWSTLGNELDLTATLFPYLSTITSTFIALTDDSSGDLRGFSFNGTDFTLTDTHSDTYSSAIVTTLKSTEVLVYNGGFLYTFSILVPGGGFTLSNTSPTIVTPLSEDYKSITAFNNFQILLSDWQNDNIYFFNYQNKRYYTDFDMFDFSDVPEDTVVKFSDGTNKLSRRVNRFGKNALLYFNLEDSNEFEQDINDSLAISLVENAQSTPTQYTVEYLLSIERANGGEDYVGMICRFITSQVIKEFDLTSKQYTNIDCDGADYYSDDNPSFLTQQAGKTIVTFPNGIDKIGSSLTKKGYNVFLYLGNEEASDFIEDYQVSSAILLSNLPLALGNVPLLERQDLIVEDINESQKKITIPFITSISHTYFNLNPSGTYTLSITRTGQVGSPWSYTTDFPLKSIPEGADIETIDNNQGVNVSAKNITKSVTRATFYVNQTTAFNIKHNFELGGTVTINSVTVLEQRNVTINELAPDLFEVIVDCLVDTEVYYPLS